MPRGQTTWPAALCGHDGPSVVASDANTKLRLFCWTAGSVVTQTQREETGWPVEGKEILGTESTTIISLGSCSDVTCLLPVDRYYLEVMASSSLACLAWLALAQLARPLRTA